MLTLEQIKKLIRVSSNEDDEMLQLRMNSAIAEATRYLNEALPPNIPEVWSAIVMLIQADYEGDPLKRGDYRCVAEQLMNPHRRTIGI